MTYHDQHAALIAYLKAKVEARDWHGVSDAACDLRVLEASDWKWEQTRRSGSDILKEMCDRVAARTAPSPVDSTRLENR